MNDSTAILQDVCRRKRLCVTRLFKVAISGTVALGVLAAGWWLKGIDADAHPALFAVGALLFYAALTLAVCWLFFMFSFWLRSGVFKAVCFGALIVWGCTAYFLLPVDQPEKRRPSVCERLVEAPNRAAAAFFPSRGGFELLGNRSRYHYFAYHFAVVFFVAAVLFSIFGRELVNRLRKRMCPNRHLHVFWDDSEEGRTLARHLLEQTWDRQPVFMLPPELRYRNDDFKVATHRLDAMDAIWMTAGLDTPSTSNIRGDRHYFLGPSGHDNVCHANQLIRRLQQVGYGNRKIMVYVAIENDADERIFAEWADSVKNECAGDLTEGYITPVLIRQADLIARKFIVDYPMLNCPGVWISGETAHVHGAFRVLLLGLGAVGKSVLREMVGHGQFVGTSGFSVDVIEADPSVRQSYQAAYSEAIRAYHIRFLENVDVDGVGFEKFISSSFRKYNRIVVCLAGDEMNVRVADRIAMCFDSVGVGPSPGVVFARISDPHRYEWLTPNPLVTCFGNLDDVCLEMVSHSDPLEQMAKVLNGEWAKDKSDAGLDKAWRDASYSNQCSSRASALGELSLVRLLGFRAVPAETAAGQADVPADVSREEFDARLNACAYLLACNEHLRWNAYHLMLGYTSWDMVSPPLEWFAGKQVKANQLATCGKHAAIVAYDQLPEVDYRIACALRPANRTALKPENFVGDVKVDMLGDGKLRDSLQAYDIHFVRKLYDNLTSAGMKLVKMKG